MIALLGKGDPLTDGVKDYCTFVGEAMRQRGGAWELMELAWEKCGMGARAAAPRRSEPRMARAMGAGAVHGAGVVPAIVSNSVSIGPANTETQRRPHRGDISRRKPVSRRTPGGSLASRRFKHT